MCERCSTQQLVYLAASWTSNHRPSVGTLAHSAGGTGQWRNDYSPPAARAQPAARSAALMAGLTGLILRHSSTPILVLWNVWLWWVWVAVTHFDTLVIPTVLHSAIGICLIVGVTLNTNACVHPAPTSSLTATIRLAASNSQQMRH